MEESFPGAWVIINRSGRTPDHTSLDSFVWEPKTAQLSAGFRPQQQANQRARQTGKIKAGDDAVTTNHWQAGEDLYMGDVTRNGWRTVVGH